MGRPAGGEDEDRVGGHVQVGEVGAHPGGQAPVLVCYRRQVGGAAVELLPVARWVEGVQEFLFGQPSDAGVADARTALSWGAGGVCGIRF